MTLKESLEQRTKDLKASMRHLEHENADLKFLNNQYMQRLIAQEKESHAKLERILELQEKNSQPVIVQTPGRHKWTLPYHHQRMKCSASSIIIGFYKKGASGSSGARFLAH